jgi:4'-phosphopantetheinyl transferase EntD
VHALGVDAEPHGPLPETVLRMIALPEEVIMLA